MSNQTKTQIQKLPPVDEWPTRKLPQARFDATVKASMDQMSGMVGQLNSDFIPKVNAINLEVAENAAYAGEQAQASAASARDSAESAQDSASSATDSSGFANVSAASAAAALKTEERVKESVTQAQRAANNAADSAVIAQDAAKTATDAALRAEAVSDVHIATLERVGIMKPDGKTTTVSEDGTLTVIGGSSSSLVLPPTCDLPQYVSNMEPVTFTLTGSSALAEPKPIQFFSVTSAQLQLENASYLATDNKATISIAIPSGVQVGDVITIEATATDSLGLTSAKAVFRTTVRAEEVTPPSMTKPVDGSVIPAFDIVLASGAFSVKAVTAGGTPGTDTHAGTQYRIKDINGNVLWTSQELNGAITTTTLTTIPSGVPVDAQCRFQARYKGKRLGWSEWGDDIIATMTNNIGKTTTPSLTSPVNGSTIGTNRQIVFVTSAFATTPLLEGVAATDTQTAAQYQILNSSGAAVWTSGELTDSASFLRYAMDRPSGVANGQQYQFRARHKGAKYGWSDWSEVKLATLGTTVVLERLYTCTYGNGTFTVPDGITELYIFLVGGRSSRIRGAAGTDGVKGIGASFAGGSGGHGGSGQQAGRLAGGRLPVTPGETLSCTAGTNGAEVTYGTSGTKGGTSAIYRGSATLASSAGGGYNPAVTFSSAFTSTYYPTNRIYASLTDVISQTYSSLTVQNCTKGVAGSAASVGGSVLAPGSGASCSSYNGGTGGDGGSCKGSNGGRGGQGGNSGVTSTLTSYVGGKGGTGGKGGGTNSGTTVSTLTGGFGGAGGNGGGSAIRPTIVNTGTNGSYSYNTSDAVGIGGAGGTFGWSQTAYTSSDGNYNVLSGYGGSGGQGGNGGGHTIGLYSTTNRAYGGDGGYGGSGGKSSSTATTVKTYGGDGGTGGSGGYVGAGGIWIYG